MAIVVMSMDPTVQMLVRDGLPPDVAARWMEIRQAHPNAQLSKTSNTTWNVSAPALPPPEFLKRGLWVHDARGRWRRVRVAGRS